MQRDDKSKIDASAKSLTTSGIPFLADTKTDPILDIPQVPFDAKKHEQFLKQGTYKEITLTSVIGIEHLNSPTKKPTGTGFGTARMREAVQSSINAKCPGQIIAEASTEFGTPHLFYLKMGMVPEGGKSLYLEVKAGEMGLLIKEALNKLSEKNTWDTEILQAAFDETELIILKKVLLEKFPAIFSKPISLEDIIKQRELVLSLKEITCDYVKEDFIPTLLKILAKTPAGQYPNTQILGNVRMKLSEKGFARWKFVIDHNLEFVPFRELEHMDLSLEQRKQLKSILEKNAKASPNPQGK